MSTPAAAYADLSASVVALAATDADKSVGVRESGAGEGICGTDSRRHGFQVGWVLENGLT
jgi:hypothetical protein